MREKSRPEVGLEATDSASGRERLAGGAASVLCRNHMGSWTRASSELYPHPW